MSKKAGTLQTLRPLVRVTTDGSGVVSHAGSRLLADLATVTGLDTALAEVAGVGRQRRSAHDPGRVLADLAVLLADGGEAISDLAVLREQPGLFGPVASTPTAWRVLDGVAACGQQGLQALRAARAAVRERAWLARAELGRPVPTVACRRPFLARAGDRCRRDPGQCAQ
jgi:hypothetical protein